MNSGIFERRPMNKPARIQALNKSARDRAGDVGPIPHLWMSATLIERTKNLFSRLYNRVVSHDEAVIILGNVGRLIDVLHPRITPCRLNDS
jgi:hypothetical protein